MNKQELRSLIREEIRKVISESKYRGKAPKSGETVDVTDAKLKGYIRKNEFGGLYDLTYKKQDFEKKLAISVKEVNDWLERHGYTWKVSKVIVKDKGSAAPKISLKVA